MSSSKNSVGLLVLTAVTACYKKFDRESIEYIKSIQEHKPFSDMEEKERQDYINENFTMPFVTRVRDNAEVILNTAGRALQWGGVQDSPVERVAKVYSSCIRKPDKTPKIIKETFSSIHWLIADMLFEGSKKKTTIVPDISDSLDF